MFVYHGYIYDNIGFFVNEDKGNISLISKNTYCGLSYIKSRNNQQKHVTLGGDIIFLYFCRWNGFYVEFEQYLTRKSTSI